MKKIAVLFALLFVSSFSKAEPLKTVFNPFTGVPDYITRIDSNTIQGGTGCTVITNSSGTVTINCAGGGASTLGVDYNGVSITSPTAQINFTGPGVFVAAAGSTATVTISSWPATSPAAPFNSVQFNSTGTFNGSPNFTTDGSSVTVSTAIVGSFGVFGSNSIAQTGTSDYGVPGSSGFNASLVSVGIVASTNTAQTSAIFHSIASPVVPSKSLVIGSESAASWNGTANSPGTGGLEFYKYVGPEAVGEEQSGIYTGGTALQTVLGSYNFAANLGTGTVTNVTGSYSLATNHAGGIVTNAVGLEAGIGTVGNVLGSTTTTSYGIFVDTPIILNRGFINTNYGIYVDTQIGPTTNYGIYSAGNNDVFSGTATIGNIIASNMSGSGTQCVQVDNTGRETGTGSSCGSSSGGTSGTVNAAAQYSDAYYSVTGTSNVISGLAPGTSGYVLLSGGSTAPPFFAPQSTGGNATLPLPGGATNYIQVTNTLQPSATFYVDSGTIVNQLNIGTGIFHDTQIPLDMLVPSGAAQEVPSIRFSGQPSNNGDAIIEFDTQQGTKFGAIRMTNTTNNQVGTQAGIGFEDANGKEGVIFNTSTSSRSLILKSTTSLIFSDGLNTHQVALVSSNTNTANQTLIFPAGPATSTNSFVNISAINGSAQNLQYFDLYDSSPTWTGTNTFNNIAINGTCTGTGCGSGGGGGASTLGVNLNGVSITTPTAQINFTGNGVSASATGSTATITISGYGVNVMNYPYNAKCDGSTNDSAAFTAAMAASTLVYVPSGKTCIVDNLAIPNNVKLYGIDQSATLKKIPATPNTVLINLAFENNPSVENLTFDENGSTQTYMIYSQNSNFTVDHCRFTNSGSAWVGLNGIFIFESTATVSNNNFDATIEGTPIISDTEGPSYKVDIFGNTIDGAQGNGISAYNFTQNYSNIYIHDNRITNILDSSSDMGATGNGIDLFQLNGGKVYNNFISTTVYSGIRLNSSNYNTVTGNYSGYSDETAVYIELGSAGNIISNNTVFHGNSGIVDANVNNRIIDTPNTINGNFIQQMVTAGIHVEHAVATNNTVDSSALGITIGHGGTTHDNFVADNKVIYSSTAFTPIALGIDTDPNLGVGTDTVHNNSIEGTVNAYAIAGIDFGFNQLVSSITRQNPVQVIYSGVQPGAGTTVCFSGIDYASMYQMNGKCGVVSAVTSTSFTIAGINSTGFSSWIPDFLDHTSQYFIAKTAGGLPNTAIGRTVLISNQSIAFALLGTPNNGSNVYVPDGTCTNGTLTGSGSGTFAAYNGAAWVCLGTTSGGGGGGSSTLAVTTGSSSGWTTLTSSPTSIVNFDSSTFNVFLKGGATAFVQLNASSVTLQGLITAASLGALTGNQTITLTGDVTGSGATSIATTAAATQANIKTFSGAITHTSSTTFNGTVLISTNAILPGATFYQNGTQQFTNPITVANGGTGTASPGLVAGTNITSITGTWPNQTINATTQGGGSGGIVSAGTFTWVNNFGIQASTLALINATSANTLTISSAAAGVLLVSVSSSPAAAPSDFSLTISSQNGTPTFGVQYSGHIVSSGTAPSMGTCGSSPSVIGTDTSGHITVGSGVVTSCTLNFANPFANAPDCIASTNSTAAFADVSTVSTTSVTFGLSATLGSGTIWFHCYGEKG